MRITLVHNPSAGDGGHSRRQLQRLIEAEGHRVAYQSIKDGRLERALANPGDVVLVAGGDGAVSQVARLLAGRRIPISILPVGTANNIAQALGIRGSAEQLIAAIPTADRRPFDLGVVRGPELDARFLEGVGMGLFTEAMCMIQGGAEPEGSEEKVARDCRFLRGLSRDFPAQRYSITADGDDLSGEYILCEVLNIRAIGPGLCFAPGANPADGWLDLVLVDESRRGPLHDYLAARCAGEDRGLGLPARRARQVRISEAVGGLRVDDEIERTAGVSAARLFRHGGVVIEVEPGALEFLIPA
jgi:diacylglycerol kinase family enzyme